MNLDRKTVLRLRKELINQLVEVVRDGTYKTYGGIAEDFRFDDGKEELEEHTPEHGQGLSARNIEYLFAQTDGIFESPDKADGPLLHCWKISKDHLAKLEELETANKQLQRPDPPVE